MFRTTSSPRLSPLLNRLQAARSLHSPAGKIGDLLFVHQGCAVSYRAAAMLVSHIDGPQLLSHNAYERWTCQSMIDRGWLAKQDEKHTMLTTKGRMLASLCAIALEKFLERRA